METRRDTRRSVALLLLSGLLALGAPAYAQIIEQQSFTAASGEMSGDAIVASTTIGEAIAGVAGGGEIVSGAGNTYWTVTPVLPPADLSPLVGAIVTSTDPVPVGMQITASAPLLVELSEEVVLQWFWGDGTTSGGTREGSTNTAVGTHTYATPGVYRIVLEVSVVDMMDVATFEYVVIYDPSVGFITGGGWIDSPPDAYPADPTLTGRANFGFVSRYKKGKSAPEGSTQFHFKAADFTFYSTSYEWMVISGPNAKYKGSGSVNGEGDYGFILTAVDGQIRGGGDMDKFRLKVWAKATGGTEGEVVYDNMMGASEDSYDGTALSGGSITIQKTGSGTTGGLSSSVVASSSAEEITGKATVEELPETYALEQNYPNPFNPMTTIHFDLPERTPMRLLVYDVLGREVARLVEGRLEAGRHQVQFEAGHLASGVYLYRIEAGAFVQTRRMLLLR